MANIVNQQITKEIESKASKEGITPMEAAEKLLKEFETDNLIYSAAQVQLYIDAKTNAENKKLRLAA